MNNVTMTCPECHVVGKAIGDPDERDNGATGKWYCFSCRSGGAYSVEFVTHVDHGTPAGEQAP